MMTYRPIRPKLDYASLRIEFVNSNTSLAQMADRHDVKLPTLRKYAERHGWHAERVKAEQLAVAAASDKAARERVSELVAFNADDLKIAKAIRAKVAKKIASTGDNIIPMNELRILASAAEAAQRMGRLALGASTDNLGHAGQDGQGPIEHAEISREAYLEARARVLQEF
jgi:hypothetical protein